MVEIGGISGGKSVFVMRDHGQGKVNFVCGWGVHHSVDSDLLVHLGSGIQFLQNLLSEQSVHFQWRLVEQVPKWVHYQHHGPESIFVNNGAEFEL